MKYEDVESVRCQWSWWSKRLEVAMRNSKMVARFNVRSPEKVANILKDRVVRIAGP